MKRITTWIFFGFFAISTLHLSEIRADQDSASFEEEIPVKALLAPWSGFEEKNVVQVVLYGTLPNSCYTLGRYEVEKDESRHTLTIHQYAIKQTNGVCTQESQMPSHLLSSVPFTNEVSLGNLVAGEYHFIFNQIGGKAGHRTLDVSPNIVPGDTLPYAVVSNLSVPDVVSEKKDIHVTLSGVLNSSCIELNPEVEVKNQGDVSILFPTVTVKKSGFCAQVLIPYEKTVNLGKANAGIRLIHARSMNGKAVNKVIQVE